jgi:hypothetical protein
MYRAEAEAARLIDERILAYRIGGDERALTRIAEIAAQVGWSDHVAPKSPLSALKGPGPVDSLNHMNQLEPGFRRGSPTSVQNSLG